MRRSAYTRPPVWQVGQYWNDRFDSDTSRIVSPHTEQGRPVRPCTRMWLRLSALREPAASTFAKQRGVVAGVISVQRLKIVEAPEAPPLQLSFASDSKKSG